MGCVSFEHSGRSKISAVIVAAFQDGMCRSLFLAAVTQDKLSCALLTRRGCKKVHESSGLKCLQHCVRGMGPWACVYRTDRQA